MNTAAQLVSGYAAYTNAKEIGATAEAEAHATTPITITTVSSPECVLFSIGVVSTASGAGTVAGHC